MHTALDSHPLLAVQVNNLKLDELEFASLRGDLSEASVNVDLEAQVRIGWSALCISGKTPWPAVQQPPTAPYSEWARLGVRSSPAFLRRTWGEDERRSEVGTRCPPA